MPGVEGQSVKAVCQVSKMCAIICPIKPDPFLLRVYCCSWLVGPVEMQGSNKTFSYRFYPWTLSSKWLSVLDVGPEGTAWGCVRGCSGWILRKCTSPRRCWALEQTPQQSGHSTKPDSSKHVGIMLSGTPCDFWASPCRARSWALIILVGPPQFRVFYDYMISRPTQPHLLNSPLQAQLSISSLCPTSVEILPLRLTHLSVHGWVKSLWQAGSGCHGSSPWSLL